MIAEVSKGVAALREACTAEPAYQIAHDLWNGLKQNDLAAQVVLTFSQLLRFNKRTRYSLPAAKRQEDKRWVRILRQEGWNLCKCSRFMRMARKLPKMGCDVTRLAAF